MSIYLNILANLLCVAGLAQTSPGHAKAPNASAQPAIAIKEAPRARIVYLPHTGAYWSIGPTIAKVRSAQDIAAPLFVRYNADPRKVSPANLQAKVGFVLEIGKIAPDGFEAETQPSELVAWMRVENTASTLARHYTALAAWSRENGYEPTGPVIEHYPSSRKGPGRVEIQLVVQKAKTPPTLTPTLTTKTVPSSPPAIGEPTAAPVSTPVAIRKQEVISQGTPPQIEPTGKTSTRREETRPPPVPTQLEQPKPKPRTTTRPPERASHNVDRESGEFHQLALRLIPPRDQWSRFQTATIGPKVMRVRTIAHLAKTKYGTDAAPITNLSGALTDRYTHVLGTKLASTFKQPSKKGRQTRIVDDALEQLDRLFSDLLTDKIDAPTVQKALLRILTKQSPDDFQPKQP